MVQLCSQWERSRPLFPTLTHTHSPLTHPPRGRRGSREGDRLMFEGDGEESVDTLPGVRPPLRPAPSLVCLVPPNLHSKFDKFRDLTHTHHPLP